VSDKLTDKQRAFIEHYLRHWNATKAAIDAGYSEKRRASSARRTCQNLLFRRQSRHRLAELKMSADEVLTRLTDQARGSIAPFMRTSADGSFTASICARRSRCT
jgi:phage terminase small subunit